MEDPQYLWLSLKQLSLDICNTKASSLSPIHPSIHPSFDLSSLTSGCRVSSVIRIVRTSISPDMLSSSSGGILRHNASSVSWVSLWDSPSPWGHVSNLNPFSYLLYRHVTKGESRRPAGVCHQVPAWHQRIWSFSQCRVWGTSLRSGWRRCCSDSALCLCQSCSSDLCL